MAAAKCETCCLVAVPLLFIATFAVLWGIIANRTTDGMEFTTGGIRSATYMTTVEGDLCQVRNAPVTIFQWCRNPATAKCGGNATGIRTVPSWVCIDADTTSATHVKDWLYFDELRNVPGLDERIMYSWFAQLVGFSPYYTYDFALTTSGGFVHFAPTSPATTSLIRYLSVNSRLFQFVLGDQFATVDLARQFAASDANAGTTWAIVELVSPTAATPGPSAAPALDFVIHMNRSAIPSTTTITSSGFGRGAATTGRYLASGFLTLQSVVNEWFGRSLGVTRANPSAGVLNATLAHLPMPYASYSGAAVVSGAVSVFGAVAILFGFEFPVSQMTTAIVAEKKHRTREVMLVMGLRPFVSFVQWAPVYLVLHVIIAVAATTMLTLTILNGTSVVLVALVFVLFGLSCVTLPLMIGALFTNTSIASTVAVVGFMAASIPGLALPVTTPYEVWVTFSVLFSPCSFVIALQTFFEAQSVGGLTIDQAFESRGRVSVGLCCFLLSLSTVAYAALGWFFDRVVPNEFGGRTCFSGTCRSRRRDPPEPLTPESHAPDGRDARGVFEVRNQLELPPPVAGHEPKRLAIALRGLWKEYSGAPPNGDAARDKDREEDGTYVAVRHLTLDLYEGEVCALLGQNGAGKTTALSLMTGLVAADEGDCFIYSRSVQRELTAARRDVGYCPQHDVLWDRLTCRQHVEFFARIKGVPSAMLREAVDAAFAAVELADKADEQPETLSGGQKRKLSLAMALVAGSRVLLLDEPTSGMDVQTRRQIWQLLRRLTPTRCIVLTTHFLEEADILGHTVAIMAKGRLRCFGSPTFLKVNLGVGYALTLNFMSAAAEAASILITTVQEIIPSATVQVQTGQQVTFKLPTADVPQFARLLERIELLQAPQSADDTAAVRVTGHGISATTLEEVFVKIAEDDDAVGAEPRSEDDITTIAMPASTAATVTASTRSQVRALLVKRFHIGKRNLVELLVYVLAPIIDVLIAVLLRTVTFPTAPRRYFDNTLYRAGVTCNYANCPSTWSRYTVNGTDSKPVSGNIRSSFAMSTYLLDTFYAHGPNRFGSYVCQDDRFGVGISTYMTNTSKFLHAAPHAQWQLQTAALRHATSLALDVRIGSFPLPLTSRETALQEGAIALVLGVLLCVPFAILPSQITGNIVQEKESGVMRLLRASGLKSRAYWTSNAVCDLVLYYVAFLLVLAILAAFHRDEYVGADAIGAVVLLFIAYGFAAVSQAYVASFCFRKVGWATGISALVNAGFGLLLVVGLYALSLPESTRDGAQQAKFFFRLLPTFAFGEGLLNIGARRLTAVVIGSDESALSWNVAGWAILYLFGDTCIFIGALAFLESATAPWLLGRITRFIRSDEVEDDRLIQMADIDDDVAMEAMDVDAGRRVRDAIVTKHLRKVFDGDSAKVTAVSDLTLSLRNNEVIALLGGNGAGKTTAVAMICGDEEPDRGEAWVAGLHVATHLSIVQGLIGYCPQSNALIDKLTAEEHLRLVIGIRGIEGEEATAILEALIKALDLEEHRHKRSKRLSGGYKRRLSTGLSILGNPRVVVLDEPTAGTDPVARRKLFAVIRDVASRASVLLTTHHLEEAEALADRAAIMVKGQLKCIGTLPRLKQKFGSGFELVVRFAPDANPVANAEAAQWLQANLGVAGVTIQESHGDLVRFALPSSTILSRAFTSVEHNKSALRIDHYILSQTSLESVFLRITADADGMTTDNASPRDD